MIAADDAASRSALARGGAVRAARLRAIVHIVDVRKAVVFANGAAAVQAVTGLIAAVAIATEVALVTAATGAQTSRSAVISGMTSVESE